MEFGEYQDSDTLKTLVQIRKIVDELQFLQKGKLLAWQLLCHEILNILCIIFITMICAFYSRVQRTHGRTHHFTKMADLGP